MNDGSRPAAPDDARGAELDAIDGAQWRATLVEAIRAIARALEKRDPYTAGHQERVAELAVALAAELRLPPQQVEGIRLGALVHDIGKISVPADILGKPTELEAVETDLVREHPQAGYDILHGVAFPWPIDLMVLQHHERLDGSGYPSGLRDGEIMPEARILAVADVVEAIASHRPYRPGLGLEDALDEIVAHRGTHYDAAVVDACVRLFREKGFRFTGSWMDEPQPGFPR